MEVADLNLITYVIKIIPHNRICKNMDLDPNATYYYAIEREGEKNDAIVHFGNVIRWTSDIRLAEIFETGADAKRVSKTLTMTETTTASVHPASRKIFFEASLMGLR